MRECNCKSKWILLGIIVVPIMILLGVTMGEYAVIFDIFNKDKESNK